MSMRCFVISLFYWVLKGVALSVCLGIFYLFFADLSSILMGPGVIALGLAFFVASLGFVVSMVLYSRFARFIYYCLAIVSFCLLFLTNNLIINIRARIGAIILLFLFSSAMVVLARMESYKK